MKSTDRRVKAYDDPEFLASRDARSLRILAEYLEPLSRFDHYKIEDTIVFMGSARLPSRDTAQAEVDAAERGQGDLARAQKRLEMSEYYEAARTLAHRFTDWSKQLSDKKRRFVVCTGGGPGIMEAANRGASEARGLNVGLTISIPNDEFENPYVTRQLGFHFHYFFMRKFWFTYLAKAVVVFPGGYGTLDELFELLTLVQTRRMRKPLPMVLFGVRYWSKVINFKELVDNMTIDASDLDLFHPTDSIDEAYDFVVERLTRDAIAAPGPTL